MKLQYNSPVILTYTLLCVLITALTSSIAPRLTATFFTLDPSGSFANPLTYFRLFSHVAGHADWNHLIGNFTFILLLGPILEEKHGSRDILFMILITALITGILQSVLFGQGLLGASGVVFMLILLGSFANFRAGRIPITFILVAILFIGQEIYQSFQDDQISQFAHIVGGMCGALFGFIGTKKG